MRTILLSTLILIGCTEPRDTTGERPDAQTTGVIRWPCNVQLNETCAAAKELGQTVCARRRLCDDLYTVPYDQCVAWEMEDACIRNGRCDLTEAYPRWMELRSCLQKVSVAQCEEAPGVCQI